MYSDIFPISHTQYPRKTPPYNFNFITTQNKLAVQLVCALYCLILYYIVGGHACMAWLCDLCHNIIIMIYEVRSTVVTSTCNNCYLEAEFMACT